jgi:sugar phosphate isomerase/epimerase
MMNSDRRSFLKVGALAGAAVALPNVAMAQGAAKAAQPSPVRLGIASYTFRNFTRDKLIGFAKELGIGTLNLKDTKDHLPSTSVEEEQKAIADYAAAGLKLTAAGTIYFPKDEDDDIRSKFEYCKRAGIKVIVAGDPAAATLPRIEKFVKEYDIKFAIHNHGPEDKIWHSPLDVLAAVKGMDPRMGCCIDVGHTLRAGVDPVKAIRAVGPRLFDMHVKDLTSGTSKESQVAVGRGILDFKGMFQQLIAMKYPGNVDLEYEIHGDDPMPGVIESFAYMRGVLAGMGYKA